MARLNHLVGLVAVVLLVAFMGTGTVQAQTKCDCIVDSVSVQGPSSISNTAEMHFVVVYHAHSENKDVKCSYVAIVTVSAFDKNGALRDHATTDPIDLKGSDGGKEIGDFSGYPGKAGEGGTIQIDVIVKCSNEPQCPGKTASKEIKVVKPQ